MPSPAACPACGSMDLYRPYHGRRTNLWLSSCRDCRAPIRSTEFFTVLEKTKPGVELTHPTRPDEPRPNDDGMMTLMSARMAVMKQIGVKPVRMREIGEEG